MVLRSPVKAAMVAGLVASASPVQAQFGMEMDMGTGGSPSAASAARAAADPAPARSRMDQAFANDPHIPALQAFLDRSVAGMVARGERKAGTGGVNAWLNNKSTLANSLLSDSFRPYKTCYEQAAVTRGEFLAAQAAGEWRGWTFEEFDATAPWRKGEGIDHMFVKATAPDGRAYQVDPWYGWAVPFVEPKYEPGVWDWWTRGNGGILNIVEYWEDRLGSK